MKKDFVTNSAEETQKIAAEFAADLHGGEVIALLGDLGAGKTTFTQGLAAALGSTARVKSPTFTVMQEYPAQYGSIRKLVHIDFYRFEEDEEVRALELDDYRALDTVIIAEWPNKISDFQDKADYLVEFIQTASENERKITISSTK